MDKKIPILLFGAVRFQVRGNKAKGRGRGKGKMSVIVTLFIQLIWGAIKLSIIYLFFIQVEQINVFATSSS